MAWSPRPTSTRTGPSSGRRATVQVADWTIATNPPPAIGGPVLAAMLILLDGHPADKWSDDDLVRWVAVQRAVLRHRAAELDVAQRPRTRRAGTPGRRPRGRPEVARGGALDGARQRGRHRGLRLLGDRVVGLRRGRQHPRHGGVAQQLPRRARAQPCRPAHAGPGGAAGIEHGAQRGPPRGRGGARHRQLPAPTGSRSALAQVLASFAHGGYDLQQAIDRPRVHLSRGRRRHRGAAPGGRRRAPGDARPADQEVPAQGHVHGRGGRGAAARATEPSSAPPTPAAAAPSPSARVGSHAAAVSPPRRHRRRRHRSRGRRRGRSRCSTPRPARRRRSVETTEYDLGARRWHATGETLPDSVLDEIRGHDAILLGAVGDPGVPSGVLERGLLLRLRFELDHYVNLRPARLYPGVTSPLGATRGDVDFVVVREGTEGPYVGNGGALRDGHPARDRHRGQRQHGVRRRARRPRRLRARRGPPAPAPHPRAQAQRAHLRRPPVAAHRRAGRRGVPRGAASTTCTSTRRRSSWSPTRRGST